MSSQRARILLANGPEAIPKEVTMIQQFFPSADLTPIPAYTTPNMKFFDNIAEKYEVYECKWQASNSLAN